MQAPKRTITRRAHWRNQRYGPARALVRRIYVEATKVVLPPSASRQLDMLDALAGYGEISNIVASKQSGKNDENEKRPIVRSYWRRQPYGPGRRKRRMTLIDVRQTASL